MGFIIIGIGSISDTGLNGAILQIISHGFIDYVFFILTKWVEWLSQCQKYSQFSVSYQWLLLHCQA
ncbi:hypothetical protein AHAS_Ahas17G0219100 [Arachis hypogaea]